MPAASASKPLLYWAMTRTASPWFARLELAVCIGVMIVAHVGVS
jgi:hypothetical protein